MIRKRNLTSRTELKKFYTYEYSLSRGALFASRGKREKQRVTQSDLLAEWDLTRRLLHT